MSEEKKFDYTLSGNVSVVVHFDYTPSSQGSYDQPAGDEEADITSVVVQGCTNVKGEPSDDEDACILSILNEETVALLEEEALMFIRDEGIE